MHSVPSNQWTLQSPNTALYQTTLSLLRPQPGRVDCSCMNIKALSPPPFYLLSASTLVSCNNVLIGFSYFHSGEYKRGRKGLSHSGLVWLPAVLFLNALSWPCEFFFFYSTPSARAYTLTHLPSSTFSKKENGNHAFGFFPSLLNSQQVTSLCRCHVNIFVLCVLKEQHAAVRLFFFSTWLPRGMHSPRHYPSVIIGT